MTTDNGTDKKEAIHPESEAWNEALKMSHDEWRATYGTDHPNATPKKTRIQPHYKSLYEEQKKENDFLIMTRLVLSIIVTVELVVLVILVLTR